MPRRGVLGKHKLHSEREPVHGNGELSAAFRLANRAASADGSSFTMAALSSVIVSSDRHASQLRLTI